jgi:hypothetical protein
MAMGRTTRKELSIPQAGDSSLQVEVGKDFGLAMTDTRESSKAVMVGSSEASATFHAGESGPNVLLSSHDQSKDGTQERKGHDHPADETARIKMERVGYSIDNRQEKDDE